MANLPTVNVPNSIITTPWLSSDDIINVVKRRIMVPLSEVTFSVNDILNFANEEMMGSQVPSVLTYHQEYFIQTVTLPLIVGQIRYPIPNRALGMKLRYIFFIDISNQMYDMTRTNPNDQAFFLDNSASTNSPYRYYVENNEIVLNLSQMNQPTGSLIMGFYMRPNQLVTNDQAAIVTNWQTTLTLNNDLINPGDTVSAVITTANTGTYATNFTYQQSGPTSSTPQTVPPIQINLTAVASNATLGQFNIGPNGIVTATNFCAAINTGSGLLIATNGTPATAQPTISYLNVNTQFITSNSNAFIIPNTQTAFCAGGIPTSFTNLAVYDVLQTKPGHKILNFDIQSGFNTISGNTLTFPTGTFPNTAVVGDYVCLAYQCIIPQLPPELHNILAERTCSRILSAMGDTEALTNTNAKIQEMEQKQGAMINNRIEGNSQKVLPRKSILTYGKTFRNGVY